MPQYGSVANVDLQRTSPRSKSGSRRQDDVCFSLSAPSAAADPARPVDFIDETQVVSKEAVDRGPGGDDVEADPDSPSASEDDNPPAPPILARPVLSRTTSASSGIFDPGRSPSDRFLQRELTSPQSHQHSASPSLDRREIQDPQLRQLMKDVYLDESVFPLRHPEEARLLGHFVQNLASWVCQP
jgi:hypothetical protein